MIPDVQIHDKHLREKRRESRHRADGVVQIEFANPRAVKLQGQLVDVSSSGFRMTHDCTSLATGLVVEFRHSEVSGRARVMWNRIQGSHVETGFLVVEN